MNFKKLLNNSDAVSPVIGVILMVAITVILAAAIGSSVFGDGPTDPAPQANLEMTPVNITAANVVHIKLEHLGGDPIHFEDTTAIKVMASLKGDTPANIYVKDLGTMGVGEIRSLPLYSIKSDGTSSNPTSAFSATPATGDTVNIKIVDVKTNQLITDQDIRLIK
jgi:flagellin-like protein